MFEIVTRSFTEASQFLSKTSLGFLPREWGYLVYCEGHEMGRILVKYQDLLDKAEDVINFAESPDDFDEIIAELQTVELSKWAVNMGLGEVYDTCAGEMIEAKKQLAREILADERQRGY
jgi:hypothetical protein